MLTVMEAIQSRRSIRKFKPEPVPDEVIDQMLEAARLAPSARNRQPWRFQVVKDPALKEKVFKDTVFGAEHVLEAPVVIVCGSETLAFAEGHQLAPAGAGSFGMGSEDRDDIKQLIPEAQFNTAIAVEHMVLAGTALGLGTCWVQRIRCGQIAKMLGWPRHIVVCTLLLVGYPDEDPPPRPRLALEDMMLGEVKLPQ